VIHELMHLASYSNDINIAEALGVWSLGSKDPNDPAVMGEASSAWDKELQKHCK